MPTDERKNSFVMFRSFVETIKMVPSEKDQLTLFYALADYGLDGVEHAPYPLNLPLHQMIASISTSQSKWEESRRNGADGGRPRKWIDETEAMQKKVELKTWKAVADYFDVTEDTLYKLRKAWEHRKSEKPKNLNSNGNVNKNDNANANVNSYLLNRSVSDGSPLNAEPPPRKDATKQKKVDELPYGWEPLLE